MSTCQNKIAFNAAKCYTAIAYLNTCIESVNLSFDTMVQYITTGSHVNTNDIPLFSDPETLASLTGCMCRAPSEEYIKFLLCYDEACAEKLGISLLMGAGLYWNGFCLADA
jgi:hypothetical protein